MKKTIFTFLAFILFLSFSCEKDLLNPEPSDTLPPATTTGENTFGCLVNGEPWIPDIENGTFWDHAIYAKHDREWPDCDQLLVAGKKQIPSQKTYQEISPNVWCPELGENKISYSNGIYWDYENCQRYYLDTLSPHILFITKLDTINNIASGTFEFTVINEDCSDTLRISEGRFDVDSSL